MAYALQLRQNLDRIATEMKAMVTAAETDGNRGFTAEEITKYHAMTADYDRVQASIAISEKTDKIGNDLRNVSRDQAIAEFPIDNAVEKEKNAKLHSRAFSKYIRNGMERMDTEERQFMQQVLPGCNVQNAQSTTTTQGGYLIPQGFSAQLEEAKKWFGGIEGVVGKFTTATGNPWPWPTINDTTNKGRIIGQNVQVTETDMVFGQVTFNAYIGSSDLILVPLALMEDSYFDLDALVARLLGTRLGRLYNNKCTIGTEVPAPPRESSPRPSPPRPHVYVPRRQHSITTGADVSRARERRAHGGPGVSVQSRLCSGCSPMPSSRSSSCWSTATANTSPVAARPLRVLP